MTHEHCSQAGFYAAHHFNSRERRTRLVVLVASVMMAIEVIGGLSLGSMALLADGFHMGTHVGALGISAFAYGYARRHAQDPAFSFGTGKVIDLAGFTSAVLLGLVALYVLFESVTRWVNSAPIHYGEAIVIALLGLAVNVGSALILRGDNEAHRHHHDHDHHAHDNNFRSAYMHVVADAVTSLLALAALFGGWKLGWRWLDPLVGIIGAFVILSWSWVLMRDTSAVLLDRTFQDKAAEAIRKAMGEQGASISDLHIWRVGPSAHAVILAVKSDKSLTTTQVRELLRPLNFAHITVEIQ